jgi:ketosteroid isomerase-like protein
VRFAVSIVALALAACPSAKQTPVAPPTPATPVQVVAAGRALVEEWRQAYEGKSFDALAKLYARGPELVVVQDGLPLIGWSSVDAMLRDRLARAKQVVVRVKDVQVTAIAPTAASVVATITREIGDGVTTVTERGTITFVIHRDDAGDWRIVAEHYSYKKGT